MDNLINKLKQKNPDIKEAEIEGLLYLLKEEGPISNSEFIYKTGLPKETLKNFKASSTEFLDVPKGDEVKLNDLGYEMVEKLSLKPYRWSLLTYSHEDLESKLEKIRKDYALGPKREYDQFFATTNTAIAKGQVLQDKGMIEGKSIAIIGDDDLVSITLGLMNANYREIVVFDIDPDVLSIINSISEEYGIEGITTVHYDVRNTLGKTYVERFDVVLTDPPYTRSGISLFLNKSIKLLKSFDNDSGSYIFLCYGNSLKEPEKSLKVQEVVQKYNLIIEDKINKFNRYHGALSIGSASSLYVLKKNKFTDDLGDSLKTEIYTFENIHEEKFPYVDHFVFKLYQVPQSVVGSKSALQKATGQFCKWHKLKVVDTKITKFKRGGLTLTYVLAQSNLVVHTWPEKGAVHIDLITCEPILKKDRFAENLSELFMTNYIEINNIE